MIIDVLKNLQLYKCVNSRFSELFSYILNTDFSRFQTGKHETNIEGVFFLVNEYTTKIENLHIIEGHRTYIDVQYMISGEELIDFEPLKHQSVNRDYDQEADYILFNADCPNQVLLAKGMVAIFFPKDLHMPSYAYKQPSTIRKIVFKVKID